jgi:hypothetical protein
MNIHWQDPDLYFLLYLLAGLGAFLAIIYECMRKFRRRKPVLDGLLRDDGAADAQSAHEFQTIFNMTSQARKEAMIKKWMRHTRRRCMRIPLALIVVGVRPYGQDS